MGGQAFLIAVYVLGLRGFRRYQIIAGIVFRAHVQIENRPQVGAPLNEVDRT